MFCSLDPVQIYLQMVDHKEIIFIQRQEHTVNIIVNASAHT
jgi:hypothetical protein